MKTYRLSPKWLAYFLIVKLIEGGSVHQADNDFLTNRGILFSFKMALRYRKQTFKNVLNRFYIRSKPINRQSLFFIRKDQLSINIRIITLCITYWIY